MTEERQDAQGSERKPQSSAVMLWKAVFLAGTLAVVGIALVVVLWLLITLTISLIGSL